MGRRRLNGRGYKALFTLSLVVPLGLLTAFRLTGILDEPATITETVTLDAVKWEIPRPTQTTHPCEILEATYDDGLLTKFDVSIWTYGESSSPNDWDFVRMGLGMSSTAEMPAASVESISVDFREDYQPSLIWSTSLHIDLRNLSLVSISSGWIYGEIGEASIKLTGINHPCNASFSAIVEWDLPTANTENHQVEITFQLTYYNGTAYKKVVQPFQFGLYTGAHYLDIDTHAIGDVEIPDVKVWVDGNEYYSPIAVIATHGIHTIEVEPSFHRGPLGYTFLRWQDQIEDNPRTIYLNEDKSFTAYYNLTYP